MSHRSRRRNSLAPSALTPRDLVDDVAHDSGVRIVSPSPGLLVAGRFRMERRIASGAMGDVWQGVHCELRLRVAIKTLRPEMAHIHEVVARFSREAFLLGRLQSDHVVRVLDFIQDERLGPVLVTELIDGSSLASLLASRRLTVEEAIDLAIDLVSGLRELHRAHIVHRDVKPANVLMRRIGGHDSRAVFIDLGVSRLASEEEETDQGLTEITTADRSVGTFEYMAPEQILSSRNVTPAADFYSVGAILFRAVSGRNVFGESTGVDLLKRKLHEAAPPLQTGRSDRVARGLEEIVARALSVSPEERHEVADEMLADLSLLRDAARRASRSPKITPSTPPAMQRSSLSTMPPPRAPGGRRLAGRVVVGLVGLAAGVLLGIVGARHWPDRPTQPASSPQWQAERCTVTPSTSQEPGKTAVTIVCQTPASER